MGDQKKKKKKKKASVVVALYQQLFLARIEPRPVGVLIETKTIQMGED